MHVASIKCFLAIMVLIADITVRVCLAVQFISGSLINSRRFLLLHNSQDTWKMTVHELSLAEFRHVVLRHVDQRDVVDATSKWELVSVLTDLGGGFCTPDTYLNL